MSTIENTKLVKVRVFYDGTLCAKGTQNSVSEDDCKREKLKVI